MFVIIFAHRKHLHYVSRANAKTTPDKFVLETFRDFFHHYSMEFRLKVPNDSKFPWQQLKSGSKSWKPTLRTNRPALV